MCPPVLLSGYHKSLHSLTHCWYLLKLLLIQPCGNSLRVKYEGVETRCLPKWRQGIRNIHYDEERYVMVSVCLQYHRITTVWISQYCFGNNSNRDQRHYLLFFLFESWWSCEKVTTVMLKTMKAKQTWASFAAVLMPQRGGKCSK